MRVKLDFSGIVVYDKEKEKYVEEIGSKHHAYAKFRDSDEAIDFLTSNALI